MPQVVEVQVRHANGSARLVPFDGLVKLLRRIGRPLGPVNTSASGSLGT
jgi:hypothetical protein